MSAVESGIVGYQMKALDDTTYNMVAIPFAKVDATGMFLEDIDIKNHTVVNDWTVEDSDFIQIWRPEDSGYDQFYFYDEEMAWCGRNSDIPFGQNDSSMNPPNKYANGLPAGTTFWYLANKDGTRSGDLSITIAGAVDSAPSQGYTLYPSTYNMVASPYPAAVDLNDDSSVVILNHSVANDWTVEASDFIQIWRPEDSGYDQFYFYDEEMAWCGRNSDIPFGQNDSSMNPPNKYANGIPAGTPFWYLASPKVERAGDLSIDFKNPTK